MHTNIGDGDSSEATQRPVQLSATGVRPMRRDDLPAVETVLNSAFKKTGQERNFDFRSYIERLFFGSPAFSPENGSVVYDTGDRVTSVILAIPMRFVVHGKTITARLLCAFASDGKLGALGAARLSRGMRASKHDMLFSDTASPVSADHWVAIGGNMLPIESLQWHKALKPFCTIALRMPRRSKLAKTTLALTTLGFVDGILRRWKKGLRPPEVAGARVRAVDYETFRREALAKIERFSIRPEWSYEEFHWLVEMSRANESLGELKSLVIENAEGYVMGAALFFGQRGRTAYVLNLVCDAGRENDVLNTLFCHFDDENYAHITGMSQPFLINALYRQNHMSFRHDGYFCMATRDDALREKALAGDIYIGGLCSESWSKLITDY
ncbi:GNAT family N-acetyltransferase [Agrobacterium tumefaciens]|uniref:GNAT family N-acetyltransferase n=2 Tax=Rhizobium/Agrobacterium group TaxID=227290 RepID=A0AAE6BCE4_AGRTU|nr:GNAT family N-acetyltransferase [Agrobacterium tumefaciens]QCL80333.1 GNAT family N-acetyltransferase [Agrobacterium tumefaciens]